MLKTPSSHRQTEHYAWELGFPQQGYWTDDEFMAIEGNNHRLKELVDGFLELLPVPTLYHLDIALYLCDAIREYLKSIDDKGLVVLAPSPVRFSSVLIREPDLFYLSEQSRKHAGEYATRIDFAVEVVSGGREDRKRDLVTKPKDYAKAGVKEYWIVDPKTSTIHVLALNKATKRYRRHGKFTTGQTATSKLFKGFSVAVADVFKKR
jgi:Uma2 family endonuclease